MYINCFVYISLHVLPSWRSLDSKVENKSDTIYRNLKNKFDAIKRKKTNHIETTKLTQTIFFTHEQ